MNTTETLTPARVTERVSETEFRINPWELWDPTPKETDKPKAETAALEMAHVLAERGGFSLYVGREVPKGRYLVNPHGRRPKRTFVEAVADILYLLATLPDTAAGVGGWESFGYPSGRFVEIDIFEVTDDVRYALKTARKAGHFSIWDRETMSEIKTGIES